jgi:GTPase SAR1 family protein
MNNKIIEEFNNCVVKIKINNEVSGTGFFVAPGIVMTCIHLVVKNYEIYTYDKLSEKLKEYKIAIVWKFKTYPAIIKDIVYYNETDDTRKFEALFLEIENKYNSVPIIDNRELSIDSKYYVFGYPKSFDNGDSIVLEYTGKSFLDCNKEIFLLKFKDDTIKPGFSGSPILNMSTGALCGMIIISCSVNRAAGGRAIPITLLIKKINKFRKDLDEELLEEKWFKMLEYIDKKIMFVNLKDLNPIFIGREKYIEELSNLLDKHNLVVLYGIKGSGKTQIVLKYIENYKKNYEHIAYIDALNQNTIIEDYSKMLELNKDYYNFEIVKFWAEKNKKWLFVYDNLDDIKLKSTFFYDYIVNSKNGKIIIISSLNKWNYKSIEIKEFTDCESYIYLEKIVNAVYDKFYKLNYEKIDKLPLLIEQFGLKIKHNIRQGLEKCINNKEIESIWPEYYPKEYNVLVVGDGGTGKTQFINSFVHNRKLDKKNKTTEVREYEFNLNKNKIKFIDTPSYNIIRLDELEINVDYKSIDVIINVVNYDFLMEKDKHKLKYELCDKNIKVIRDFLKPKYFITVVNKADMWLEKEKEVLEYFSSKIYNDSFKKKLNQSDYIKYGVIPYISIKNKTYKEQIRKYKIQLGNLLCVNFKGSDYDERKK